MHVLATLGRHPRRWCVPPVFYGSRLLHPYKKNRLGRFILIGAWCMRLFILNWLKAVGGVPLSAPLARLAAVGAFRLFITTTTPTTTPKQPPYSDLNASKKSLGCESSLF